MWDVHIPWAPLILAVVTPRDFSAMHRLKTDEVWHFDVDSRGIGCSSALYAPPGVERSTLGPNLLSVDTFPDAQGPTAGRGEITYRLHVPVFPTSARQYR